MRQDRVNAIGTTSAGFRRSLHDGFDDGVDALIRRGDDFEIDVAPGGLGPAADLERPLAQRRGNAGQVIGPLVVERQQQPRRPRARGGRPFEDPLCENGAFEFSDIRGDDGGPFKRGRFGWGLGGGSADGQLEVRNTVALGGHGLHDLGAGHRRELRTVDDKAIASGFV